MIQIYTTPSCASCRKAKKWFDQYKIPYSEKNIFSMFFIGPRFFRFIKAASRNYASVFAINKAFT